MRKISISFLIVLLCVSLFMAFPCKAATVWSDNFNDGNYDGWTVAYGSFSAENKTLETEAFSLVYCPSDVTTGTWSFDLSVSNNAGLWIMFMSSDPTEWTGYTGFGDFPQQGMDIYINGIWISAGLSPVRDKYVVTSFFSYNFPAGTSGWQHFDITRDSNGRTCVYHNGTLSIDVVIPDIITSEYFAFCSPGKAAIDNIVVSDTVDIQPPAAPFYTQTWFYAAVGAVAVVVVAIVVLLMRKK